MNYLLPLMLGLALTQDDGSGPENRPDPITTAANSMLPRNSANSARPDNRGIGTPE